jgi:hypothetical protein
MSSKIYLINEDENLLALRETEYDSEDLLQRLLASHPDVLAGEQIDAGDPRRWLLVEREYGVPDAEDASDRWALDHLLLDQDGVPTLVEVKRSTDTRTRRRVAGQMLDYAANAVRYWPVEKMQAHLEAACEARDEEPAAQIATLTETEPDDETMTELFWQNVEANLQRGRIRMLFVADHIPTELQRIVEFLNEQMKPAEVLAVEVKQYVAGESNMRTLVPTVIGQTAEAKQRKRSDATSQSRWDENSFFAALSEEENEEAVSVARELQDWTRRRGLRFWWGKGNHRGSFFPLLDHDGDTHFIFSVWTKSGVNPQFQHMKAPFDTEEKRRELQNRLNAVPEIQITDAYLNGRPGISYDVLSEGNNLRRFTKVFDWYLKEIRGAEASTT